eukprot:21665-Eustigmatos_ZCMA.PRE.1
MPQRSAQLAADVQSFSLGYTTRSDAMSGQPNVHQGCSNFRQPTTQDTVRASAAAVGRQCQYANG